jgi:hypothetical protein
MLKKYSFLGCILLLVLVLSACNNEQEEASDNEPKDAEKKEKTDPLSELTIDEKETVATVNGKEIKGDKYNLALQQIQSNLQMQGQAVSKENGEIIKQQAVDGLVGEELIMQDLDTFTYEIEEEKIDEQIKQIRGQYEDEQQFEEKFLKENDLTLEKLEEEIKLQMKLDQYLVEKVGPIDVTDKEIKDFYASYTEQVKDAPELEELKEQIKVSLQQTKQQKKITEIIKDLKEKAEVEIHI